MSSFVARYGKIKSKKQLKVALKHNLREIVSVRSNINSSKSKLNISLGFNGDSESKLAMCEKLIDESGVNLRANVVYAVELVVSLSTWNVDCVSFFYELYEWAKTYYDVPIISYDIHLDEPMPHCHIIFLPLRDKRMRGSELVGFYKDIEKMKHSIESQVGQKYDIKLAAKYHPNQAKKESAELVIDKLEGDPIKKSKAWSLIKTMIYKNPDPFKNVFGFS